MKRKSSPVCAKLPVRFQLRVSVGYSRFQTEARPVFRELGGWRGSREGTDLSRAQIFDILFNMLLAITELVSGTGRLTVHKTIHAPWPCAWRSPGVAPLTAHLLVCSHSHHCGKGGHRAILTMRTRLSSTLYGSLTAHITIVVKSITVIIW